jgi:hypothetical protein
LTTHTEEPDMTKLLSITENVVIRDRVYGGARKTDAENREYGRLHKCICDLAKEAQKFRKAYMKGGE